MPYIAIVYSGVLRLKEREKLRMGQNLVYYTLIRK